MVTYFIMLSKPIWEALRDQNVFDNTPEDARDAFHTAEKIIMGTGYRYRIAGTQELLNDILASLRDINQQIQDRKNPTRSALQFGVSAQEFNRYASQMPLIIRKHYGRQPAQRDSISERHGDKPLRH